MCNNNRYIPPFLSPGIFSVDNKEEGQTAVVKYPEGSFTVTEIRPKVTKAENVALPLEQQFMREEMNIIWKAAEFIQCEMIDIGKEEAIFSYDEFDLDDDRCLPAINRRLTGYVGVREVPEPYSSSYYFLVKKIKAGENNDTQPTPRCSRR